MLEWRLDPTSDHRLPDVRDLHQPVIVVCSAGYASSLAAASLSDLGFERPADLVGGYQAWRDSRFATVRHGPGRVDAEGATSARRGNGERSPTAPA